MLALLLAGVVLLLSKRATSSGATIAIATGVKLTAGVFLPFALAAAGRPLGGNKRRDLLIGAGVTAISLIALSIAMFGVGTLHLPGSLALVQSKGDWHSIPGFIGTELGLGSVGHLVGVLLGIVFIGVFGRLVWRVWRGELDWIVGAGWAAVALLVTASSLLPWYAAWLIPFAALGRSQRLWKTALVITGVILAINLVGFIPNGTNLF
jgi:alpha-1,6-mannosyltransferase